MNNSSPDYYNSSIKKIENYFIPIIVFFIPFLFYWRTIAPGIFWGDGPEITTASFILGIIHPTGYPLLTLLIKIITSIPIGSIAFRSNLLSCLLSSFSALIFYFLLKEILEKFLPSSSGDKNEKEIPFSLTASIISAGGTLLFSSSSTIWFHSITTEVYIFHIFFLILLLKIGLNVIGKYKETLNNKESLRGIKKNLMLYSMILGLSFTNHLLTLASLLSLFVLLWLSFNIYRKVLNIKQYFYFFIKCFLIFLIGLSIYVILPIRAKANPSLNWGDPENLKNMVWVISGGEFKIYKFLKEEPEVPFTFFSYIDFFRARLSQLFLWFPNQWLSHKNDNLFFSIIILITVFAFALLGFKYLYKKEKIISIYLISPIPLSLFFLFTYNIPDIDGYFLSIFPVVIIFFIFTITKILYHFGKRFRGGASFIFSLIFFICCIFTFSIHLPYQDLSNSVNAQKFAYRTLNFLPFDSMILTQVDNDIFPLWYIQNVENFRRDVTVVGATFLRCGWYSKYFTIEQLKRFKIKIEDRVPLTEYAFFYSILKNAIWENIDSKKVFGFLKHPVLEKDLRLIPMGSTLTNEEFKEDEDYYLPSVILYRYEKK